ncbi:MAG: hypothetical protein HY789_01445 [Deltaproteobacteria bacterium]|nr:hypothetical protein [Deltaproteobacteria bacterium]
MKKEEKILTQSLFERSIFCLLPFAFCLLPFAFCLLPFAFCLLPFAFCAFCLTSNP